MVTQLFRPDFNNNNLNENWFEQNGDKIHFENVMIELFKIMLIGHINNVI